MPGSVLKAGARKLIFDNIPQALLISLIYIILITVVFRLSGRLSGSINMQDINQRLAAGDLPGFGIIFTNFRPVGFILALLLLLLQPVVDVGYISYCLKLNRFQNTEIKDLFNGFLFTIKVICIFFITTVMVFLWSLLLIIPGIIAMYRYRQAYYILLDDPQKSALQCISESKQMMHGRKVDLMIIDLSFIGWYFLDLIVLILLPPVISFPVISIWLAPYTGLTRAAFYEDQIRNIAV